ncbi:MAG: DNA mismatch repair endonuclease MutL [Candidatus Methanospirareceae archaeon]
MRSIFVLDEHTISKIAAGEVIDRPASVLKELVENSIDAGGRRIIVEIGKGGKDYIRVTDDGCGISEEDVELAFKKHATSKIRRIEDLMKLQTLGFRGEALPSIAAVARVEMSTRHVEEDFGTYLRIEGGKIKERRRITRNVGTTVEVKSLFYNLPARMAAMGSKSTEFRHIMDVFVSYAIIYPEIKFEIFHDGKLVMRTLGNGSMRDVLLSIYGSGVVGELVEVKTSHDSISIYGYVSKPTLSYNTKKHVFTYVNRRFVRSEVMDKAIKRGYGSLLSKNAFPFAVCSLYIDPDEINVNVHPKKQEVRFYDENKVFWVISNAIHESLQKADLIPDLEKGVRGEDESLQGVFPPLRGEKKRIKKEVIQARLQKGEEQETLVSADAGVEGKGVDKGGVKREHLIDINLSPLYQVHDSYIIAQSESGDIIIIDQHAAAERINFERLLDRYGSRIEKQELLRPLVPKLSPYQFCLLRENEEWLREAGFDMERLGDDGYIIRTIPVIFHKMIEKEGIMKVIEHLLEDKGKKEERVKAIFSTAACIASVKAGEKLSYGEMREIVEGLKRARMPFVCPHGRPTMIRLSKREIERRFGRG